MSKHALLSASSSHRWLSCPPSAKLCDAVDDETSTYALQGTDAHSLCEYKVNKALGKDTSDPTDSLSYFDSEMDDLTDEYRNFVLEELEKTKEYCSDPEVLIEAKLDYSKWVPDGFGTGDCIIVADNEMEIIDFKYGLGVLVDAKDNPQMMCYALGAIDLFDGIYDIEQVNMTIFQPRRSNVSSHTISKVDLLKWADKVLSPTAKLAYEGKGEFMAGDHCQFCNVKATCKKRAEANLELAKYDFEEPVELTTNEIASILPTIDKLVSWANDVKAYVLKQAMSGVHFTGYKVVEGRSVRKFTDEDEVTKVVEDAGFDPYEKKMLGITAMTTLLGKMRFNELLGDLIHKAPGKPTIVPEDDKRPEINTAQSDFKENKGGQ